MPIQGIDDIQATPQFARRRIEHVQQVEHVKPDRSRGSGRLDPDGRVPARMQGRVQRVVQRRDVARESQERAGEAQLARRAQRVPVFDYGVAVLAVHETPPHRLNWLFADMPSASCGGFRFYLVFQFIPRTAAVR